MFDKRLAPEVGLEEQSFVFNQVAKAEEQLFVRKFSKVGDDDSIPLRV